MRQFRFPISVVVTYLNLCFLTLGITGCVQEVAPGVPQVVEDISDRSGLRFWHDNGMTGELYFCEVVGPGSALFDFDSDGDLDVFLPQGHLLESGEPAAPRVIAPPHEIPAGGRLFRNDGNDSQGIPRFVDVTAGSGIEAMGYGMGCAVGDVDGDGDPDLLLTNFGPDQLWINDGDGVFHEGARDAGIDDGRWTTSALFVDLDADGDEDLYVCSYVDFTLENHKPCYAESSAIEYCGPTSYPSLPDRLYRNEGDGTFRDVTSISGIGARPGAGLGVVSSDVDGDGRLDLYVANDGMANRLWLQVADFHFEDAALLAGCAVNRDGRPEASMGADMADFDGDGDEDIFLTHLSGETNTLYVNDGHGIFDDHSSRSGLGLPSRKWTGFGTAWFDLQNDGRLDLFVTNGAVKRLEEKIAAGDPYPLSQPDQIFVNLGDSRFEQIDPLQARVLQHEAVGRGASFGDIDNDGDLDILVTNNCGYAKLLQNQVGSSNSWIGLDLRRSDGRQVVDARCEIESSSGFVWHRRPRRGGSYLSSNDPRIVVGLADYRGSCVVRVQWPGGVTERFQIATTGHYQQLIEHTGVVQK
ncbi:MAG: CRTAC1 family protein [Planctomycetota bacterium]|nr:CRTAC1 family protein [Planctomycetota bacterium]